MKQIFGDSWKTSVLGLFAGLSVIVQGYVDQGETNIYKIGMGIMVFLLGRFAADHKA